MNQVSNPAAEKRGLRDWLIVIALAGGFLLWGIFIFYAVGVKWPPAWNFGVVPDVPGLSFHSTAGRRPLPTVDSPYLHEQAELTPQHVMGPESRTPGQQEEKKP